jgi:hypothetical protein
LVDAWDHYLAVGGYPQAVAAELKGPGKHGGATGWMLFAEPL